MRQGGGLQQLYYHDCLGRIPGNQLEVNSPWPALGSTRLALACSGQYMTCQCLLLVGVTMTVTGPPPGCLTQLEVDLTCPCLLWLTPKPGAATA